MLANDKWRGKRARKAKLDVRFNVHDGGKERDKGAKEGDRVVRRRRKRALS